MLKIAVGSDHAGFRLKKRILTELDSSNYQSRDFGTCSEEPVDYPDIAIPMAEELAKGNFDRGIFVCGSGVGSAICANKVRGVRALACQDSLTAKMSRLDNDTNFLALGARIIGEELALEIVRIWLATEFSEAERHVRRLAKIRDYERS